MKLRLIAILALFAGVLLSSCKKDLVFSDDALRIIPATSATVVRIDIPSMMKKADFESIKESQMYKDAVEDAREENPALAKVMENPETSGVDLDKMGYLFLDINPEKPRETFGGMLVSLKNDGKFEELVKTNGEVSSKGAFRYLLYDNDKIVAWTKEVALFGFSDDYINLVERAEVVFNTKDKESIVNNKDLQKAMAEAHDMSLWFSTTPFSESPDIQMGLSMAELDQDALKDNYVHGYMDFLPGKIEGKARLFLQPKLSKDIDKLFNDKVATDFSKYIPNDQVSMLLVNAISIKGIDEVLSARSQSKGFLEFSMKEYDLTIKDFREAFGGDIALAAIGQKGSDSRIGLFATNILDKAAAQKFIDKAVEGGALEKEPGDVYKLTGYFSGTGNFTVTFDDNSPRLLIRDNILFITGDEMWIEKIQAGGFPKGERIKGDRADRMNDHLFYAFFDGKGLVSFNKESADLSVKDTEIRATRGEVNMTVRMNDEKTNALKAMFESAERKYEEEKREIQ
ncbi:MAG: DUF4836 family protein [Saprospiraceae bacterium]